VLHEAGRAPQTADSARAVQLGERVVLLLAVLLGATLLLLGENHA
jgi:cobalamin biosynthesis protein CobD/CbiB